MALGSLRRPTGKEAAVIALLAALVVLHVLVVTSILRDERPVIWPLHNDTVHRIGPAADFYAVYHAGIATGRGQDPYAYVADGVTPFWYPFRYLPVIGFLAQPLTRLAPPQAFAVWVILLEVLLAVLLAVLWRRIPDPRVRLATVVLLLANSSYFLELYMGQFTFASVTLCCLSLLLPVGAVYYVLGVLLKPLVLAAVPALILQRRWWWHVGAAALMLALVSLPYFLRHPDRWQVFYEANFHLKGGLDAGNFGFVRLLSLVVADLGIEPVMTHWETVVGVLRNAVLATTTVLVLLSRRQVVMTGTAALLLAHFLTYQHVWEHHLSAVAVLAAVLLTVPERSRTSTGVILASLLLLAVPTPFVWLDAAKDPQVWDPATTWPRSASYLLVLAKVVPTATLFVVTVVELAGAGLRSPRAILRELISGRP